jgi:hypothetical protein
MHKIIPPVLGCFLVAAALGHVSHVAGFTSAALGGILLLYRACRHGVRIDDRGITVRNLYRTDKLSWHHVSRFADGRIGILNDGAISDYWAVQIVLNNGRAIIAQGTMREKASSASKVRVTMEQFAGRWQIPAQLTGTVPTQPSGARWRRRSEPR